MGPITDIYIWSCICGFLIVRFTINSSFFLTDPKQDLQDFMADLVNNQGYQPSAWATRQTELDEEWKTYRPFIMNRVLDSEAIFRDGMPDCFVCAEETASIRCVDCSGSFMCATCDHTIHKCNILHDRLSCKDGYFQYMPQGIVFSSFSIYQVFCFQSQSRMLGFGKLPICKSIELKYLSVAS